MSSLLQHHGTYKNGKVQLLFTLEKEIVEPHKCNHCGTVNPLCSAKCSKCKAHFVMFTSFGPGRDREFIDLDRSNIQRGDKCSSLTARIRRVDAETVELLKPDGSKTTMPRLYEVYRKPAGTFGCWVVFRWNNEEHIPDLSVPISVTKLPHDAKPISDDDAAKYWFN